ncbi:MAG: YcjX family protein [Acetobacteraceae bacterium]|nr:YcjX family protein [Acetobacteraceae bacterium]
MAKRDKNMSLTLVLHGLSQSGGNSGECSRRSAPGGAPARSAWPWPGCPGREKRFPSQAWWPTCSPQPEILAAPSVSRASRSSPKSASARPDFPTTTGHLAGRSCPTTNCSALSPAPRRRGRRAPPIGKPPWSELAGPFKSFRSQIDRKGRNDDDTARRAAVEWQKVLLAARDRGLKWLQPAQFVRAEGPADERPSPGLSEERLWFCPRAADVIGEATSGSLADAMAKRYKRYRKDTIALFDKILFGATHHLLLVDVLSALGEEDACNETKRCRRRSMPSSRTTGRGRGGSASAASRR